MKQRFFLSLIVAIAMIGSLTAQNWPPELTEVWEPEPRKVTPGEVIVQPPSDAIVLFDGTNLDQWEHGDGSAAQWIVADAAMTVKPGTGDLQTKQEFGSVQLHIEFRTPAEVKGEGQGRGNSGLFLQNRYELQVLDSYENRTYSNGQAGSIYKQTMPLVNASRGPGEWQSYDIIYKEPVFNDDGIKVSPAMITVLHNGVLIQNNTEIKGTTPYIGLPKNIAHGDGPLKLQDHSNPTSFRNIWIREL